MSRESLQDHISYCQRELTTLQELKTTCHTCERFKDGICEGNGQVPEEFTNRTDCPQWQFALIPF